MMNEEEAMNVGPAKIKMVYQRFGLPSAPPVLLIMGGGAQMINWPDGFCEKLAGRGLYLIRFDNRDTGLSTHFTDAPVPDLAAAMRGDFSAVSYTLSDMAADTIGLMNVLGLDSVHLVGASMGGMIAQTIALEYPDRVRSMTLMMSTTGNLAVGQPDFAALGYLGNPPQNDREAAIQWQVRSLKAVGSPKYPFDEQAVTERVARAWDRDHDPLSMLRQCVAVLKSGDRTEQLRSLQVPTLVMHGDADKMCHISGGHALAEAIPGAELFVIEGMGHGLPSALWPGLTSKITTHIKNTETTNDFQTNQQSFQNLTS